MAVVDGVSVAVVLDPFGTSARSGRGAAFLVLLGFVLSFLFIRTSARMIRAQVSWWPGNVETSSGLHLHHLVWGISLMFIAGFLGFALDAGAPWYQFAAAAFGIGAGLTADEFALWVRLDDVYWSNEGRVSLDAVIFVVAFMALVVIGTKPFGLDEPASVLVTAYVVTQTIVLSGISFFKGRIALGLLAIFIWPCGLWAASRLAMPSSPWAHRFYDKEKLARARKRFPPDRPSAHFRDRFFDAIGGRVSEPDPPS
jgi:hypothetical protein